MTIFMIFLVIALFLFLWGMSVYNNLIRLRNQVKNGWSQIDVQLQRRYDLIPNLVETVKGYMAHEKGTLTAVIEARNQAASAREALAKEGVPSAGAIKGLLGAEAALKGGLGNIFALAESYPQLQANQTMQNLQEELSTTENRIAFARQGYNDQAMHYNNAQEVFPAMLFAATFGHKPADLYQVEEQEAKKAVKVAF